MEKLFSMSKKIYILSLLVYFCAFVAARKSSFISNALFMLFFAALLLGAVVCLICSEKFSVSVALQAETVFLLLFVFWGATLYKSISRATNINELVAYSGLVALFINTLFWLYILLKKRVRQVVQLVWQVIKNNWYVFIAIGLFVICYIDCFYCLFKSDSNIYYCAIRNGVGRWSFSFSSLSRFQLGGHAAYGYSLFGFLGHYFIPVRGIGIRLANLGIMIITVLCLNGVIKKVITTLKSGTRCCLLLLFVCNPIVMGLAQEISMDMAMGCFFVWFLWSYINRHKIIILFSSLLLCFTKENAIVLLAGFMIGALIMRGVIAIKDKHLSIKTIIFPFDWYVVYSGVLFMANLVLYNRWHTGSLPIDSTGEDLLIVNTIRFDIDYILIKLKQMFIMNYQWLFCALAIAGIIIVLFSKKERKKITENTLGLLVSFLGYLAFHLLFFTYPHYRYTFPNAVFYTIFAGFILALVNKAVIRYAVVGVMSAVFLVQSFINIDFLTNSFSRFADTGNGRLLTECYYGADPKHEGCLLLWNKGGDISNEVFRDYVQNNRQYLGFEKCFELFLTEINYNKTIGIILTPIYKDTVWGADNWTIVNMFGALNQHNIYWNLKEKQLTNEKTDVPVLFLQHYNLNYQFSRCEEVWYVELPYRQDYDYAEYLSKFEILEEKRMEYGQWTFNAYRVKIKKQ